MSDIKYEIIDEVGVLSQNPTGWTKQLKLMSWLGREAKYDIRDWAPDGIKMGKGITLTVEEVKALKEILQNVNV